MKRIINIILVGVLIISFTIVGLKLYQYHKDKTVYKKLIELKPRLITEEETEKSQKQSTENKVKELKTTNKDYKMWIKIKNTNIDYPVVQAQDNEFYLYNNFYKENSISGNLFIDYRNNIEEDKNLIIYGHNIKNNTMFNNLNKFKEKDLFNNGEIVIIKDNKEYIYEVFSIYVTNQAEDYLKINLKSEEEFIDYFNDINKKSLFKKIDYITEQDKIITLCTCSYEFKGARTIVHGRLIRR